MKESILAYQHENPRWWARFFVEIPEDVKRQLEIAKVAYGIATQLAPLTPAANREILYQAAALLGVLEDKGI